MDGMNKENLNMENTGAESTNMESTNTESVNVENTNTESTNAESAGTESTNAESAGTESVNTENTNTESVNTENTESIYVESTTANDSYAAGVSMTEAQEKEKKSGKNTRFLIPAVIFIILVLILAGGALATGIIGKSKNKIIMEAMENTFKYSADGIKRAWTLDEYKNMFKKEQTHVDANLTIMDEANINIEYDRDKEIWGLMADISYYGISLLQANLYADEEEMRLGMPEATDYVLYIDFETIDEDVEVFIEEFDLDDEMANQFRSLEEGENAAADNEGLSEAYEQMGSLFYDMFMKAEVNKADEKILTVNGEDRRCKGYVMTITGADISDYVLSCKELYEENEAFHNYIDTIMLGTSIGYISASGGYGPEEEDILDAFDWLSDEYLEMDDMEIYFYLYKDVLAQIYYEYEDVSIEWNIYGGNFPLENTELTISDEFEEVVFMRNGSMDGGEYQAEYEILADGDGLSFTAAFDKDSGDFSLGMETDYYLTMFLDGNIEKTIPGTEYVINIDGFEVNDYDVLYGDITVSNECGKIEVPEGELCNVFRMTEDDWNEVLEDIVRGIGLY